MTWILIGLAVLVILDSLRLNRVAQRLYVLSPARTPVDETFTVVAASSVVVDEATRISAIERATGEDLDVIDLWPAGSEAAATTRRLAEYKAQRSSARSFIKGHTAGQAMLVRTNLLEKSLVELPYDPVTFRRFADHLARFTRRIDVAIAPSLKAPREDPCWRATLLYHAFPQATLAAILINLLVLLLPFIGMLFSLTGGIALLAALHLRPLIAVFRTPFRPPDLLIYTALRTPLELWAWLVAVLRPRPALVKEMDEARLFYEGQIQGGLARFYEPPAQTCPFCGSADVRSHIGSRDLIQRKPGSFQLDRCNACGHVFQNPRLNPDGLSFYYRDFYDGLGRERAESIFDGEVQSYRKRALRIAGHVSPQRWLDVGTGYGHFCHVAREVWTSTSFDGLDMGSGVEEAARRGWISSAHRGFLTDLAPGLEGTYDVVSMFHYLEHTTDPRAELGAVHRVLKSGGYLLIEQPNPECPAARPLGQYWLNWFQPQHLNFLTQPNFERLLKETGFATVSWHWEDTHVNIIFTGSVLLLLSRLAPQPDQPWRPRSGLLGRVAYHLTWTLSPVLLLPAIVLDSLTRAIFARPRKSFNLGLLARRT